ncbi:aminodeoxychorismate/anthranilate synthase component II [Thalassotalea agarivorans]|uniref:anthranilate synthase n=1 Tax=Thalassotalea agarivorans TaxID=349064 RepID=A0A1I0EM13_THASX|nr:aminodeoxychorismate/anthranilate synthase component II [Thalassotalea agarivorans]SET46499.1 anthranilate synthase, component II [Thalassotalea agarivorans]
MENVKIFMLDNLDSFTYNLVDEFKALGYDIVVYRNTLSADFIYQQMQQSDKQPVLVLSPGPGAPHNAGCLLALIKLAAGKIPMFGICLGHQAIVEAFGGKVDRAPEIVHGKASNVSHSATGVFEGIANPLPVARYHSLVATKVPSCLNVIAKYQSLCMAVTHQSHAIIGYQFHPESILTTYGSNLIEQTLTHLLALTKENENV